MKFPGTKPARRWTKWLTNPAWQPRRSGGPNHWMTGWGNPCRGEETGRIHGRLSAHLEAVWFGCQGLVDWWTMVDYGGLVWTAILHCLSIPSSWTTNLCATVRHLMVSGITNGGTQHPSILPIFSAHCIPLLVGESSQLCTHCFGWPIPLVFGRTNVVRIFRSFYCILNFIGCAPTTWQPDHTCHLIHLNTIFPTDFVQTFPFCEIPFVHLHSRFYTLSSIFGGYIMILVTSPCLRFDVVGNIISPHIFRFHGNLFIFAARC